MIGLKRPNNANTLFVVRGDQFTGYTEEEVLQYLNDNIGDWNS